MHASSSGLTMHCTPLTTPPPRSTSPCRGRTGGRQAASQPSLCMVRGGEWGVGDALPCPGHKGQELSRWLPCRRSQVPETVSPGSTLVTLRCTDSTGTEDSLHYALEGPTASRSRFRMEGPQLQVSGAAGSAQAAGKPRPRGAQRDRGDPLTRAVTPGPGPGLPGPLCSPRPARSPCLLPPAPLALQLCGTPRLCRAPQLCRAHWLCRAPWLCLTPPPWLDRSIPPWTMTRRPWPLWASSSRPPSW